MIDRDPDGGYARDMTSTSTENSPAPALINRLSAVASRFDALLVDVWGVLHNGRDRYAAAEEACRRFRADHGPVALISNSPRPTQGLISQLRGLGFADDFYDAVVTSGEATRAELAQRAPGPAFKLGPARDDHIYDDLHLDFAPVAEAAFVSCTGLFDDTVETPADYASLLDECRARDLEMVCANPDVVVNRGGVLIYCAGALAEAYAALCGRVVMVGKPHAPIYAQAFAALEAAAGRALPRDRVLAVGDGPHTDLAGAANQGAPALYIAGGVHERDLAAAWRDGGDPEAARAAVAAVLAEEGAQAAFAAPRLAW